MLLLNHSLYGSCGVPLYNFWGHQTSPLGLTSVKRNSGGTIFNRGTALYGLYFNRGTPRGSPSGHRLSYINRTSTSLAAAEAPPPPPASTSSPLWLRPTTPRRPSTTSNPLSASGQCLGALEAVPRGIEIKAKKCTAPIKVSWSNENQKDKYKYSSWKYDSVRNTT